VQARADEVIAAVEAMSRDIDRRLVSITAALTGQADLVARLEAAIRRLEQAGADDVVQAVDALRRRIEKVEDGQSGPEAGWLWRDPPPSGR
jgi:hypothetical protein